MKRAVLTLVVFGFAIAPSAQAELSFGTNKDGTSVTWQTLVNTHRDHPEITTEFTVLDAASAKLRGIYNGGDAGDSAMVAALTLSAGDKVTFDWYLSNNGNNIPDYYGGSWVGDTTFQFQIENELTGRYEYRATERFLAGNSHTSYINGDNGGAWYDNVDDLSNGLHVEWTLEETSYTCVVTSLVDPAKTSTYSAAYLNGATVSDIQAFRVGIWDSEQDVTVSNFTVVPEPATIALLGLGGLLLRKRR